jgi:hypothetical protein
MQILYAPKTSVPGWGGEAVSNRPEVQTLRGKPSVFASANKMFQRRGPIRLVAGSRFMPPGPDEMTNRRS